MNTATGLPEIMDIALQALGSAADPTAGATFAGGVKSAQIELSGPVNSVVFELIPSYSPGLTTPLQYRVMWRAGVMGRTDTFDFVMPDEDLSWEELQGNVSNIIGGAAYLQQTDLGVAGRVARLDEDGNVIDAAGNVLPSTSDITAIQNDITVEINNRLAGIAQVRSILEGELSTQVNSTLNTAEAYTNNQVIAVNADISTERSARQNADTDLQSQINTNNTHLQGELDSLSASTGGNTTALNHKADLDNTGHVPVAQIPDAILTSAVPVPDQVAMLALNPNTVHKGDLAVRPDGVWLLTTNDPSQMANWVSLSIINSVNGKRGDVVLGAADVNAIPVGGSITMGQVTGLGTALTGKANQGDMSSVQAQVSGILADPTLVHTTAGVIPSALLDSSVVYLNSYGQLVHKDGTIIPVGSGGGGAVFTVNGQTGNVVLTAASVGAVASGQSLPMTQITGLSTALGAKADLSGPGGTVPLVELPSFPTSQVTGLSTALGNKADLSAGQVPLAQVPLLPQGQILGLSALISGNQLTNATNAVNRVGSLETRVTTLEGGGGGTGGGGTSSTSVFYDSSNTTANVTDFTQVILHSPWGIDSDGTITGTTGTWYYNHAGVRSTDVAYPIISQNGHLQLHKWNETGAADPVYALASDLSALNTAVAAKAAQTDLVSLQNTVITKASQSDLTALSTTMDTKANTADLNSLSTTVATKANQSDLNNLTTVVGTKANQADLTATNNTVATKAAQSDMAAAQTNITTLQAALPAKADLVAGKLQASEIPTGIPQANITGLVTALSLCATLDSGGKVFLTQVPQNIPQAYIAGLGTALGNKADLVNGFVPVSQIPAVAIPDIHVVANRAALLGLTSAQVSLGHLAVISGTVDQGTYILTGADPSLWANWTELATPQAPVTSVNNQTGQVVLSWTDVGALAANAILPISQVSGLQSQLNSFATTAALNSATASLVTPGQVQNMFYNSSMVKRADYVATTAIASLAGQQSVDGVLVPNGAIVLATAQASSVNNGLWVVSSGGNWTRPADFATGSFLARDTVVIVSNTTAAANGTNNPYTVWQMNATSGFIDTATNSWTRIAWVAPPFVPVQGNGININGSTFSANVVAGGGLMNGTPGLAVDPNVVLRKFIGTVPAGNTVAGITHNLNTTSPIVSIWDTGSNTLVLAGVTVVTANSISIEFNSAPASGQYRVAICG